MREPRAFLVSFNLDHTLIILGSKKSQIPHFTIPKEYPTPAPTSSSPGDMASDWPSSSWPLLDEPFHDPYALGAADHDPYAHDPYAQGAQSAPSRVVVDAWDAQAYTMAQFSQFYEGLNEWHARLHHRRELTGKKSNIPG